MTTHNAKRNKEQGKGKAMNKQLFFRKVFQSYNNNEVNVSNIFTKYYFNV